MCTARSSVCRPTRTARRSSSAPALDQAYHPEGFYTFPTDEFTRDEILRSKRIGLNGLREHVKIETPRKLYWADRLGMLIMADVPNSWGPPDAEMRKDVEHALRGMIEFARASGIDTAQIDPSAIDPISLLPASAVTSPSRSFRCPSAPFCETSITTAVAPGVTRARSAQNVGCVDKANANNALLMRSAISAVVNRHNVMMLSVTIRIVVIDNPKILSIVPPG